MTHKFIGSIYSRLLLLLVAGWAVYWMFLRLLAKDLHGRLLRREYIERWPNLLLYGLAAPLSIYLLIWMAWAFFRWAFRDFLEVP